MIDSHPKINLKTSNTLCIRLMNLCPLLARKASKQRTEQYDTSLSCSFVSFTVVSSPQIHHVPLFFHPSSDSHSESLRSCRATTIIHILNSQSIFQAQMTTTTDISPELELKGLPVVSEEIVYKRSVSSFLEASLHALC